MSLFLTTKRRLIQWLSLVALTSNVRGVTSFNVCLPVMHCNACPLTWTICPIYKMSELIQFHESLWSREWLPIVILLGVCVIVGRFFCGWICPAGFVQDLLFKIPTPKIRLPGWSTWLKYGFLGISVVAVAYWAGKEVPYFFCSYCPTATVEAVIPAMLTSPEYTLGPGGVLKFVVLPVVLVMAVLHHRSFCKIMCPIGALVAVTNRFSLFSVRLDPARCVHCRKCNESCPMDVPVEETSRGKGGVSRNTECIECLTCEAVCPAKAIGNNSRVLRS